MSRRLPAKEELVSIPLAHRTLSVTVKRTRKFAGIRLTVDPISTRVTLALGRLVPFALGKKFVQSKSEWIESKLNKASKMNPVLRIRHSKSELARLKKLAEVIVRERLSKFNLYYKFTYEKVMIRNQKTKWGSCSNRKTLCFNYRIALLPPEYQDYLVVHELCHLKEFNHGSVFWSLVGEQIQDYKTISRKLRVGDF